MEKLENYISLNEIQKAKLCNELAQLTFELKQSQHVQCVYFAPYKNFGNIRGNVINITVVSNSENPYIDINSQYQRRVSRKTQLNQFGVKIHIDVVSEYGYTYFPLNPSERNKGNDLFNSTILFDRTGEYTKIKEKTEEIGVGENSNLFHYENLAEIYPPIDDQLEYAMDTQHIKVMNKALKKIDEN